MRQFAFVWLALGLSGDAKALGLISFALGIPILVFGIPAGVLADRMDRRVLLFTSQVASLAVTILAAVLVWADAMTTGVTFALALALGATVAFGQPVRSAIIPTLVSQERLLNAVTLNSVSQNLSQIAGPALCGAVIAGFGVGGSFAVQAGLLTVGLAALVPLAVPKPAARADRNVLRELGEGLSYVAHHPGVRTLLVVLLVTALVMAGTFNTLIPKIAKDELGTGAIGASLLFGAMGVGMLMSSLLLASLPRLEPGGRYFILTMIGGGLLNTVFGLSPWYGLSISIMFVTGWNAGFFTNLNMTLVQSNTPQALMGRVMSIYMLCMAGGMPLGALLAGTMADLTSTRTWFATCGVALVVVGVLVFVTQPSLRRMRSSPAPR